MIIESDTVYAAFEDAKRKALAALENCDECTWRETVCRIFYAVTTVIGAEVMHFLTFIAFLTGQIGMEQLWSSRHAPA